MKHKFLNIISLFRIRFFSKHGEEPYTFWSELLGFPPRNPELYELAMCHKSVRQQSASDKPYTNERLEFLGDAILNAVLADILFYKFPNEQEGFLTRTRAKVACRATLNELARRLGIDKRIKKAAYVDRNIENLYGNAFESLIGAVYLDYGYAHCKQFIERLIGRKCINIEKMAQAEVDFKSRILEWGQREQKHIQFEQISEALIEKTNVHAFVYRVTVNGQMIAEAKGSTKREAQQSAAALALKRIKQQGTTNYPIQKRSKKAII